MEKIIPISLENYENTMETVIVPKLSENFEDGTFISDFGGNIYYRCYPVQNPKGNIVVSHGYTEASEKFLEMFYYFNKAGFSVFALDHRGHGKSVRDGDDPETVYIRSYDEYVGDLKKLIETIVLPRSQNKPVYLYAHSMGGCIAVLYLQKTGCLHISKALLTAPMIAPNMNGIPNAVAGTLCKILCAVGKKNDRAPGLGGFAPNRTWEKSNSTCKERFDYWHKKRCNNRCYQASSGCNKWMTEAVKATRFMLKQKNCDKITIPVLLCQAEEDTSVLPAKHDEFIAKLKRASLVRFPGSRHEIFLSGNKTLEKYLDTVISFFEA